MIRPAKCIPKCLEASTHARAKIDTDCAEAMSAQQRRRRIEQLHAERGAKLDRLKMQRHLLYSEQKAIDTDMEHLHGMHPSLVCIHLRDFMIWKGVLLPACICM